LLTFILNNRTKFWGHIIPIYQAKNVDHLLKDGDRLPSGFHEFVGLILSGNVYNTDIQKGILTLVRDKGTEGLSDKQLGVIKGLLKQWEYECGGCGNELEWNEIDIYGVSNLCDYCQHVVDKTMKD
jgi:DNA-directed RNA polymerase subunit RPC12/RpoP